MKNIVGAVLFLIVVGGAFYFISNRGEAPKSEAVNEVNNIINKVEESKNMEDEGLKIEIIKQGAGEGAKSGDKVSVHYVGTLTDGKKFDSSRDRGTPFDFVINSGYVIKGWDKGVAGMKVGEVRNLIISPELGYGDRGAGSTIPPGATLLFEIELLKIN